MNAIATTAGPILFWLVSSAFAAPDEEKLGRDLGYPIGNAANWYYDESVRVGSFSHQSEIRGIFGGRNNTMRPAAVPLPLPSAPREPDYRWRVGEDRGLTVADFLSRQRIMGLIVVKDGIVQVERYQYERKPSDRFVSQSMAKSFVALAVGFALAEGTIASLDDRADRYASGLRGTIYGETTLRNLLRMASGAAYRQSYDGGGDPRRFADVVIRDGVEAAARVVTVRETPQGRRFNYSSPHSAMLAAVVRGATGMNLSDYLTPRLWQAVGAQDAAYWNADRTGLEIGAASLNATLRDYARLGVVLANDGAHPHAKGTQIVPRDFLIEATDWKRAPKPFHPGIATPVYGYGYQFWLYPGETRRFMMLGVFGQSMFVDPAQKLVIVQTAANATAEAGGTTLASERDAFWRGVLQYDAKR